MRTPRLPSPGPRGDGLRRRAFPTPSLTAAPTAAPTTARHAVARHAVARRAASCPAVRRRVPRHASWLAPAARVVLAGLAGALLSTGALAGAPAGKAAASIDLLDGDVAGAPVCGAPAGELEAALGLPSHRLEAADGSGATMLRWTHLGVEAEVAPDGRARSLSVQALPLDDLHGWRGTFLGPIASGTRREPVVRLLRGSRTRLESVGEERIEATAAHGSLVVDFAEGWVLAARLACAPAPSPREHRALAR